MIPRERRAELEAMVSRMQQVSDSFYPAAQQTGHHAFIEFTGLMNEYIKLCHEAVKMGIDFTKTTIHGGDQALPMEDFHRNYLNEKMQCIYGVSLDVLMNTALPIPRAKATKREKSREAESKPPARKARAARKTEAEPKIAFRKSAPKSKVLPVRADSRKTAQSSLKSRRSSVAP